MQVEQRHREAAAELIRDYWLGDGHPQMRQLADSIQNGGCKCDVFSQAFARFEASLPPSAPVVGEMAAFGASEAAGYYYPGEDQQAERAAFCDGAARAVLAESTSNDCLLVAEAVRERCAGICDSNAAQEREGMAELTAQRDRLAAENAAHMAEMIGAEIRSLDLSGGGVG